MADTGRLYEEHPAALATLYGDVRNFARAQRVVLSGTPGTVLEKRNASGFRFYAHQYYDAAGRKVDRYVGGPVGEEAAEAAARELRERIAATGGAIRTIRLLAREGYACVDARTHATLSGLRNHGVFEAGAVLVGSHAYGTLLNQLGVRSAPYATQDVDIATARLAFARPPEAGFLDILRSSGIAFVEVPALQRRRPSTSFKEPGRSFFQVDLLAPSPTGAMRTVQVPELKAHATALPLLGYLLEDAQEAVSLAREGACPLRVPAPERFAVHKLAVSQLRNDRGKAMRDVVQAAALAAVLAERHPGALEEAAAALSDPARRKVRAALPAVLGRLGAHPRAAEALRGAFRGRG